VNYKNVYLIIALILSSFLSTVSPANELEELFSKNIESSDNEVRLEKNSEGHRYYSSIMEKIETKYSKLVRRGKLSPISGSVKVKISILPDGKLKGVEIVSPNIDADTKVNIETLIKASSPFEKFPDKLIKTTDILEIITTITF